MTPDRPPRDVESSPLDPGAVLLRFRVEAVSDSEDGSVCELVVDEVVRQGPRSRPLAPGARLRAAVPGPIASPDRLQAWIDAGEPILGVLSHQEVMDALEGRVPEWKITEVR